MQAVIIAGGLGTRLRPLTYDIPKSMVPVNGKPFLEHKILLLKKQGIKDFVFCVGYLCERIMDYFRDGSKFGVSIRYSIETKPLGTGGALKNAEEKLEENFIVFNGDTYLNLDYKKVIDFYKKTGKEALVVVYDNHEKVAENNMSLGKDGLIKAYSKYLSKDMTCVDAGVYLFSKKALSLIPAGKKVSLETEVFPKLIEEKELAGFLTSQRFYDMGTTERLKKIEEVLK